MDRMELPDSSYTSCSGVTDIITPNSYGSVDSDRWKVPNSVKWAMLKISGTNTKMVIPWLPGNANEAQSKYCFYAALIEGARGVNWWMNDNHDYRDYTHQKAVYSLFTSSASFNNNTYPRDETIFLNGTDIPVTMLGPANTFVTYSDNFVYYTGDRPDTNANYTGVLNTKCGIKAFSYDSKWRIYVVNHTTSNNLSFSADLTGSLPSQTAYKRGTTSYVVLTPQGPPVYRISDTLNSLECQFYNIG